MNAITKYEESAIASASTPVAPQIGAFHASLTPVGSRATCSPPPTDTDQDWLLFVAKDNYGPLVDSLLADGWDVGGSLVPLDESTLPPDWRFNSLKKGIDNIVITDSDIFHARFLAASSVAKRLNLLSKDDRIALFQAVLYANSCDPQFTHFIPSSEFTF